MESLTGQYKGLITCVAFMGGDQNPQEVLHWAEWVRSIALKTAWYSGRTKFPEKKDSLDYLKLGPYVEALGGLKSEKTNQRLYRKDNGEWVDITSSFWKKNLA
jgi:anaerobic ribonucleoside-triphosphate reductase activating protein